MSRSSVGWPSEAVDPGNHSCFDGLGGPLHGRFDRRVMLMKNRFGLRQLQQSELYWPVRLAFLYAGVFVPVMCHAMTVSSPPDAATWQSGAIDDKLSFALSGRAGFVFYPLMLYPMVCLTLLLFRESRFAEKWVVRFGIFTGIPVAMWYWALLGTVVADVQTILSPNWLGLLLMGFAAIVIPVAAWWVIRLLLWVRRKLRIPWIAVVLVGLILYVVGIVIAIPQADADNVAVAFLWPLAPLAVFWFFSLLFGPSWAFGVYVGMTLRLLWRYPRPPRFRMIQLLAAFSWLGAFLGACRWAIERSLEEYAKLPVEQSGCYVASAAAHGHRALVGAQEIVAADGTMVRVNRQLRTLKAGELALRALSPATHRLLRRIYDGVGPALATRLANPWMADLAYLSLKPAEWVSCTFLACTLGSERRRVDALFRNSPFVAPSEAGTTNGR